MHVQSRKTVGAAAVLDVQECSQLDLHPSGAARCSCDIGLGPDMAASCA